jgi:hypothetical protein
MQAKVNKQTHIEARRYPKEEVHACQQTKALALMNPDTKPGTDAVKCKVSTVKSKNDNDSNDQKSLFSDSLDDDKKSGGNRDNPALKRHRK